MSDKWKVSSLGKGAYLFHWLPEFYVSAFFVGSKQVYAVDPINATAAKFYRAAIASVTSLPIETVIYSHDHRDHISGADALVNGSDFEIIAHETAAIQLKRRKDVEIVQPNHLLHEPYVIADGELKVELKHLGPNHSDSNLLIFLPELDRPTVIWVDGVEPGVAPYRNLPDTDFRGLQSTLEQLAEMKFDQIIGGHAGPDSFQWIHDYRDFYQELVDLTAKEMQSGKHAPPESLDGVAATEFIHSGITKATTALLKAKYGHWRGYDTWVPMTTDRVISYLVTGN